MRSNAKYVWIVLAVIFVVVFVFFDSSGLSGRDAVTTTTAVAEVNGETVLATDWYRAVQQRDQQESQRLGRALTLDEQARIKDAVFDEMVGNVLLRQELERRKLGATDQEVIAAAQQSPPPEIVQNPEFQTEGRFDPAKYQRYLASPSARAGGVLAYLEQYYRQEIPRQKLYTQVATDVYVSDARLWQLYQDANDSAQVSFVALRPELVPDAQVAVSDDEIRAYYERNRKAFDRPGRATVSLLIVPRTITAADTAAARARVEALRAEIAGGAKFEDVARRESSDSASAQQGGDLGRGGRGRFVPEFEQAAYALQPGSSPRRCSRSSATT
jgi:peptidyl-prolyl cis-trans isomerase D